MKPAFPTVASAEGMTLTRLVLTQPKPLTNAQRLALALRHRHGGIERSRGSVAALHHEANRGAHVGANERQRL